MYFLRRLRQPKCLIILGTISFVLLGTFYYELWDIPWLNRSSMGSTVDISEHDTDHRGVYRPVQPECSDDGIEHDLPATNFCVWNPRMTKSLSDCYKMLQPVLHGKPSWVFLGDDGMANIPYFMSEKLPFGVGLNITTRRHACQNMLYYMLPPPNHGWMPPDPLQGEGPVGYGKDHAYCMDCRKCWNLLLETPTNKEEYVEYLVVEYARDVSLPTRVTNTTQETAIYYLSSRRKQRPSVCVASAGVHDAAIDPPISVDLYLENAARYLALLQRTCDNVIWIGIHAVVEDDEMPQKNCRLKNWNEELLELIGNRNYPNVYVMDVWERSLLAFYETRTKPDKKYYAALARMFVMLIAGPDEGMTGE